MGLSSYNGHSGEKRDRVQRLLNIAWAKGDLKRPSLCAPCGQTRGIIDAHHEDYDKPREYVELCACCHMMVHCRFRNVAAFQEYRARVAGGYQGPPMFDRTVILGQLARTIMKNSYPTGTERRPAPGPTFLDTLSMPAERLW